MQLPQSGAFLIAGRNPYLDRFGKEAKKAFFCKVLFTYSTCAAS